MRVNIRDDTIVEEYVKYYKRRRNGEEPTNEHIEFFKDKILWDVKRYIKRGCSIIAAIDSVMVNRNR